ncbi:MAG: DUF4405 domain-containing protein [Planctomyces sp.]|nr:DUF4405 domain-containing protein [Planctomyces sp.]
MIQAAKPVRSNQCTRNTDIAMDIESQTSPEASSRKSPALDQMRRPAKREAVEDELSTHDTSEEHGRMSMSEINFWLDALLMVIFIALGIAAVIVQFVFPPGVAAKGWTLWGMSYGQWCSIEFGLVSLLGVGVLVHVMLHWTWVCSVISRRMLHQKEIPDDGIRTVYGVGLLIAILLTSASFVVAAMFSISEPPQ